MSTRRPLHSHPAQERLQRFAAGALPTGNHADVREHLAVCDTCRDVVADFIAGSAATAVQSGAPALRADSLHRILACRAAGERVILAGGDAGVSPRRNRRGRAYAAAAATVLIGLGTMVFSSNELTATDVSGDLRLTPQLPAPGDSVRAEYRGTRFAKDGRLHLRALLRKATSDEPEWAARYGTVASLVRGEDGVYRGAFVLPDSVVYGVFVVEDTTGEHVDTRGGRLWDLLVPDSAGRPAFAALRQRMNFFFGRDQQVSLATARELTTVHPDNPESWRLRHWYAVELAGPAGRDTVDTRYMPRFAAMDARLRDSAFVSPQAMDAMTNYASQLGDDSAAVYWSRRLVTDHPTTRAGTLQQLFAIRIPDGNVPARIAALERLWASGGAAAEEIALNAMMVLRGSGDTTALRRWGTRLERIGPPWYYSSFVAFTFAATPGLEAEGAARLRTYLREFATVTDLHRVLGESVPQSRLTNAELRASALAALGKALAAMGYHAAALDTLRVATELAWRSEVYVTMADIHLRRGDTIAAVRAAAFASGESPDATTETASLRRRFARDVNDSMWNTLREESRALQRRQLLATSVNHPMKAQARIIDANGTEHRLADLARGTPTVVAFWSRYCLGSLEQLPALQHAAEQLAPTGVRVVAITAELPSPALTAWLEEKGYTFDVYHDTRREAETVLEPRGTPDHVVLDAEGRVRFERVSARELVARVGVLNP